MELIKLNIGGQLFTTAKSTLVERSDYFSTLLNGNWQQQLDENGAIFIDRNGHSFDMVLKFLRNKAVVLPEDSVILAELKIAADFYGIQSLIDLIEHEEAVRQKAINDAEAERQKLVKLNVGGQHFTITKSTLMEQSNYFNTLLSGNGSQQKTDNGAIFIDDDGETFRVLLKFVRDDAEWNWLMQETDLSVDPVVLPELKKAADVYGVQSLINLIKRDEAQQKKVIDLYFYVWELNGRGRCQQSENRHVSGKTIRELKAVGFQPMFNLMHFSLHDNSYHMRQIADERYICQRLASMWLMLLDTFLYGESEREDKNDEDHVGIDEITIGTFARYIAEEHGMDRVVIEKLSVYNRNLQAKLKKKK